jgi:hypothetical protein
MNAVAAEQHAGASRRSQVAALLDAIDERRRRIYRLQSHGVTPAGLRDLKEELRGIRARLAATLATPPR